MAKVDIKMPDDFLLKLSRLEEKTDVIVPKILDAGAEVVVSKVKSNLLSIIGKGTKYDTKSTGELSAALGVSPAKQDRDGNYNVKIGFSEPRRDGESNAKLANIIEYGKSGQPAKPFLKPAKSATRSACVEAMKAELEKELGQI
ncbi:HK97 gp10 family phage protein [Bacillaceae bacterium IKA-2]|nr:HK97 gp10 family phage protein [Bacillaceae bacterium IKA-2]